MKTLLMKHVQRKRTTNRLKHRLENTRKDIQILTRERAFANVLTDIPTKIDIMDFGPTTRPNGLQTENDDQLELGLSSFKKSQLWFV